MVRRTPRAPLRPGRPAAVAVPPPRRALLTRSGRGVLAALLGPAVSAPAVSAPSTGRAAASDVDGADAAVTAIEVGPGVYMLPGSGGEPDAGNAGRIGNAGFVVGPAGVIAIDTGTSYRHGRALLAAIARTTDRPVRLALVTHARQEFLFGAAAFRERGIPVAMHRRAATLMASRCETCLKTLGRVLGDEAMRGTTMWRPDRLLGGHERLDLAGRPVQLLHFGHSSGPGDIAVLDRQSGVLFAGGLVDDERIPDVGDADLAGWQAALRALRRLAPRRVVPGHGAAMPPAAIDAFGRYLVALEAAVRALMKTDVPLSAVPDAAALPAYARWDRYDSVHRRNASIVFLRLEREQLLR